MNSKKIRARFYFYRFETTRMFKRNITSLPQTSIHSVVFVLTSETLSRNITTSPSFSYILNVDAIRPNNHSVSHITSLKNAKEFFQVLKFKLRKSKTEVESQEVSSDVRFQKQQRCDELTILNA